MAWSVIGTLQSNTTAQGIGVTHTQIILELAAPVAGDATDANASAQCQCGVRHARTPRLCAMGPWVRCGVRRALRVVAERVGVSARAVHGELGWHPNLVRDVVAHVGVVVDVEVVHV